MPKDLSVEAQLAKMILAIGRANPMYPDDDKMAYKHSSRWRLQYFATHPSHCLKLHLAHTMIMSNGHLHADDQENATTIRSQEKELDYMISQDSTLATSKHKSSLGGSLRKLMHKQDNSGSSRSQKPSSAKAEGSRRESSISDSGPYTLVTDPVTGKEVLHHNPHWPNEDSWKEEERNEGTWAFGSMMGQKQDDFGGTIG